MRPSAITLSDASAGPDARTVVPQTANRLAKADRLPVLVQAALIADQGATYTLASAPSDAGQPSRFYDAMFAAPPPVPNAALGYAAVLAVEDAKSDSAVAAAVPLPPARPKLPPPPQQHGLLDDAQIAGIRSRLRLTSDQAEYWPAVEAALRDIARTQLRGHITPTRNGKATIDVNSPEVQKLIWAAMPLIMRLREDQKREVRKLARVIGLHTVASQI
jgi:hypothetical protein